MGLGRVLGALLHAFAQDQMDLGQYNLMTYVPLPRNKRTVRGFNQAELLARHLARRAELDAPSALLKKVRRSRQQERLSLAERLISPIGCFEPKVPRAILKDKTILLVDDVITTGSTANECALVLKEAGAQRIDVLVLAAALRKKSHAHT